MICCNQRMNLNIDLTRKELVVTRNPEPKKDSAGEQRREKQTEEPLWATQVVVTDESGGDIIKITTVGRRPAVQVGALVEADRLVATPWATNGRSGVAYRAAAIKLA